MILKIPKSVDIFVCDNLHGIILLSIPCKVFCLIILNRIRMTVGHNNREEKKTRLREGRDCSDQICPLRNIVVQCIDWKVPLFVNFVDFRTFRSLERKIWIRRNLFSFRNCFLRPLNRAKVNSTTRNPKIMIQRLKYLTLGLKDTKTRIKV